MSLRGTTNLLTRSLRLDARSWWTYALRFGLVGFVLMATVASHVSSQFTGAPGAQLFGSLVFINFGFITLAGVSIFASAITEEKEEMTLGLMRMTDLNGVAILLGKSGGRLLAACLLLLAQLPFTLLTITLGGVSMGQIAAAYCTLGAYLVLLCGLGLLCSVLCARTRDASGLTVLILLMLFIAPWVVVHTVNNLARPAWAAPVATVSRWLIDAAPTTRLFRVVQTGFVGPALGYQVVTNLAAAALLAVGAWLCFTCLARDEVPAGPDRGGLLPRLRATTRRSNTLRGNALVWKDFRFLTGGPAHAVLRVLLFGLITAVIVVLAAQGGRPRLDEIGAATMGVFFGVLILEMALLAGRIFHEEVKWRTWSGLAGLPMSLPRLVGLKAVGCALALVPAVLYMLGAAALCPGTVGDLCRAMIDEPAGTALVAVIILFFIHLVAYLSLWLKWGALAAAIGIMLAGWVAFGTTAAALMSLFFMRWGAADWVTDVMVFAVASLLLGAIAGMYIHGGLRLSRLAAA